LRTPSSQQASSSSSSCSAAATLVEGSDAIVELSYRGDAFERNKRKNRTRVDAAIASAWLTVRLSSQIISISKPTGTLKTTCGPSEPRNDAILVCAGGVLPTDFLRSLGVTTTRKFGQA
jgi:hypothetical protein